MRLDHLLSKEEEVEIGLLLICQGQMYAKGKRKISGGDAIRGNTRTHPEHDG